jgi:16S rRNA (guanine966-N2)-methyltransferase
VALKVIAGRWRGRPLAAPEGATTRPTSARAREALFSMLESRLGSLEGLAVLDLFAGSGALGIEALSRGAARALFVERDPAAIRAIRANLARLGAQAQGDVLAADAARLGPAPARFDLVLLDPPYGAGLAGPALERLVRSGWLAPGGWLSVETAPGEGLALPQGLALAAERRHGPAWLRVLHSDAGSG